MEIHDDSKLIEAVAVFESLPVANQDEIILMLRRLLSERGKYPVQPQTIVKKD